MTLLTDTRKPPVPPDPPGIGDGEDKFDLLTLTFLDSPIARKLAVAWQTCGGNEDEWLEYAGIAGSEIPDARKLCFALRQNKICRDGGTTAPAALGYIRAIVAAPLKGKANNGGHRGRR